MSEKQEQSNTILDLWDIFLQYRWRFILPAFLITTGVLAAGFLLPRKYKAVAQFERRTDMVMTEMSTKGASQSFQDPRGMLMEELKGQPAIDALIKKIQPELVEKGLIRNDLDKRMLHANIARRAVVHWDIATGTLDRVRIEFVDTNPELATVVVNTLVENYIDRTRQAMNGRLEQSSGFFRQEVVKNRQRIEKLENDVLEFEIKHTDLLPENPNNIQTKISDQQELLNELVSNREAAFSRVNALRASLETEPHTIPTTVMGRNPELGHLENKLRELTQRMAHYTSVLKMKDRHPDVLALAEEITELQTEIDGTSKEIVVERQTTTNPKRAELELRLTAAMSEYDALHRQSSNMEKQLAAMESEAEKIYMVRSSYRKLQRQVQESQRQMAFWEDNLRRVEMAMAAESGNKGIQLQFIRPAVVVRQPISPNWMQLVMAAISLGLFCGALNVFVSYRTNDSFNDGSQAAKYCDLQLFGAVSEIISQQQRKVRRLRSMILYPTNAAIMGVVLFMLAALLYLDLEKPEVFQEIKMSASRLVGGQEALADEHELVDEKGDVETPSVSTPME
ncbi:GumC family protein [Poriferisphaera sp. WC338]|uniref:GumC family protein n=1 Tax=Poriferisphaera sp. WC338 TaxID=3425129 RepID=UPI003D815F05